MTSISNRTQIKALQLRTAKRAINLEAMGMTRRGRSLTAMYRDHFGLPARASRQQVIDAIDAKLAELDAEILANAEGPSNG